MNKRIVLLIIFLFISSVSFSQKKYWIYFTDKGKDTVSETNISPATIENRKKLGLPVYQFSDLPVNKQYIKHLTSSNISIENQSRWLNAVSAFLTSQQLIKVKEFSFVKEVTPVNSGVIISSVIMPESNVQMDLPLLQIEAEVFINNNLSGKNITIGIIDGGFLQADKHRPLKHIFDKKQFKMARDYVNPGKEHFFSGYETFIDWHGTSVWSMIAGIDSAENIRYGLATDADFYLARTDHGKKEFRGEEDYWIEAVEWMDSVGVRIINTSLGYSSSFDDPEDNYHPAEMNGRTTAIAKAAQIAVDEKGLLIIVSAGNEGNDINWQVLSTPADAEGVFSIGSTTFDTWQKASYSAIGPDFLDYVKPDVACYSLHGTSFSAPVITGIAACILQFNPGFSNREIMRIIEQSGHLYPFNNNYIGYGVPSTKKIMKILTGNEVGRNVNYISSLDKIVKIESNKEDYATVFHKKDAKNVILQQSIKAENGYFNIKQLEGVQRTTFSTKERLIEIAWISDL